MRVFIHCLCLSFLQITANASATYYTSPSGTGGGLSTSDPASFSSLITSYSDGDTIHLATGTYVLSSGVGLNRAVTLIGTSGTELDCSSLRTDCIRISGGTSVTLSGFSISNAVAATNTRAVFVDGSNLNANAMTFSSNAIAVQANGASSVLGIASSTFTGNSNAGLMITGIVDSVVSGNDFTSNGLAISVRDNRSGNSHTISGNTFTSNSTGVKLEANTYSSSNSVFSNTFNSNTRAGVWIIGSLEQSNVSKNHFSSNAMGIDIMSSSPVVTNNLIQSSATDAIHSNNGVGVFAYNTIVTSGRHGFQAESNDRSQVYNSIFYGNAGWGVNANRSSSGMTVSNNDFNSNTLGTFRSFVTNAANVTSDPMFTSASDFSLQTSSPLIDAASTALYSLTDDINGANRVQVTTSGSSTGDIGAFEVEPILRLYYIYPSDPTVKDYLRQNIGSALTIDGTTFVPESGVRLSEGQYYTDPDIFKDSLGNYVLLLSKAMSPDPTVSSTLYRGTATSPNGTFSLDGTFSSTFGTITSTVLIGSTFYVYGQASGINVATYDPSTTTILSVANGIVNPSSSTAVLSDPTVVETSEGSGRYLLFYKDNGNIYKATSSNGVSWTTPSSSMITSAEVPGSVLVGNTIYLYYIDSSTSATSGQFMLTTSADGGVTWTTAVAVTGYPEGGADPNPVAYP